MTRFDKDRERLAAARDRARAREEYDAAEKQEDLARKIRGTRELRERFRSAVRSLARQTAFVTIDAIRVELAPTVIGLTLKHAQMLAREAGLHVGWDGVIERDANFEAYIDSPPTYLGRAQ